MGSARRVLLLGFCSTLGSLSDGLLRPGVYDAIPCRSEAYIVSGDGTRLIIGPSGGRHAAKRPTDTSTVVQNEGGVRLWLVALLEG